MEVQSGIQGQIPDIRESGDKIPQKLTIFCEVYYNHVLWTTVKFSGSWWVLGSHTYHLSSPTLLAGSHTSSYSSIIAFPPCPDHDSYNTVVEMFDCRIFLSVIMHNFKNVFGNFKKHFMWLKTASWYITKIMMIINSHAQSRHDTGIRIFRCLDTG